MFHFAKGSKETNCFPGFSGNVCPISLLKTGNFSCCLCQVVGLLKSAEKRERVAFPFAAASAAHFPSVTAQMRAAVIGRVNDAVTVTGWSRLKWPLTPRVTLMKHLVLLHVEHAGGFWPNYWRQSAVRGRFGSHRRQQGGYLLERLIFILITRSQGLLATSAKC